MTPHNHKTRSRFGRFRLFMTEARLEPFWLLVPVFLSMMASAFEAVSLAALTPFLSGFLKQDFSFVRGWPGAHHLMALLPKPLQFRNSTIFVFFVAVLVASIALKSLVRYLSQVVLFYQGRKMNDHLRRALVGRYLNFGKAYSDKTGVGQQLQVLMTHPVRIMTSFAMLNHVLNAIFLLVVYLISIFMISWQTTIFAVIVAPGLTLSMRWLITKIKRSSELDRSIRAELNQKTVNILNAVPFIQSQCAETREMEAYARLSRGQQAAEFSIDKKRHFVEPFQEVITLVVMLLILSFMSYLMARHNVGTAASYIVYFFILRRMMASLHVFNQFRAEAASIAAPIREVLEVLEDDGKPFVPSGKIEFIELKQSIEFRHLNFSYENDRKILEDVSFVLPEGKMTALVGPSGSGKSSVIHLLLRFYDCPPGTIFIDGVDIRKFTLTSLRKRIAWVSQDAYLFNDTLRANIIFGLDRPVGDSEIHEVLRRARLLDFAQKLPHGLDTLVGDRGVNLSGGEKQRVSIARAILKRSRILLLDEATSALDTLTEKEIREALDDLIANQTAIVIAHRFSTIRHAQHVIYLENGRVCEEGALEDLLALRGKFYRAWQEQKFY